MSKMNLSELERLARIRLKSRGIEEYSRERLMVAIVGIIENLLGKPPVGFKFVCRSFYLDSGQWYGDILEYGQDGLWILERGRRTYYFKSIENYLETWSHPGRICYEMIRAYLGKESGIRWWTKESVEFIEDRLRYLGFERAGYQYIISLTSFCSRLVLYKRKDPPFIKVLLQERDIKLYEAKIRDLGMDLNRKYHIFMISKDTSPPAKKSTAQVWLENGLK